MSQNYINHVVLVLDESSSMRPHAADLVRVADGQVKYLARRSQELDQETRVSVYTFSDSAQNLIYDKDVLRLPSMEGLYTPHGMTALIDAVVLALDDLAQTATLYGDHAFLAFVLTDGQENRSRNKPVTLNYKLHSLPENWTVAALVPDQRSVWEAKAFGFAQDNISIWDPTDAAGVAEVGETIRRATDSFMEARTRGVRGTRSLFSTGLDAVNASTVHGALTPLAPLDYDIISLGYDAPIADFVRGHGRGRGYYQLTKTETIQPQKDILVRERATGRVFGGSAARDLIGLPPVHARVKPDYNPDYDIFVQSTSVNRKLLGGTDLIVRH